MEPLLRRQWAIWVSNSARLIFYFIEERGHQLLISCINLSNPSEAALQHLSEACRPATFGLNKENVHDESYRKAVELNPPDFATTFVVADSSLLDIIRSELLEGHQSNKSLRAELYKLNVYGEKGVMMCVIFVFV